MTAIILLAIYIPLIYIFKVALYGRQKPSDVGYSTNESEVFISNELKKLDPNYYRVLNNLLIPSGGNTKYTHIDHVVVSIYGIFCIETKGHRGIIFGNATEKYWTHIYFKSRERFYNPLYQNFGHVKALEKSLLKHGVKIPIISLVVFPFAQSVTVSNTYFVGKTIEMLKKIEQYKRVMYTEWDTDSIYTKLESMRIIENGAMQAHTNEVRELVRQKDAESKSFKTSHAQVFSV